MTVLEGEGNRSGRLMSASTHRRFNRAYLTSSGLLIQANAATVAGTSLIGRVIGLCRVPGAWTKAAQPIQSGADVNEDLYQRG